MIIKMSGGVFDRRLTGFQGCFLCMFKKKCVHIPSKNILTHSLIAESQHPHKSSAKNVHPDTLFLMNTKDLIGKENVQNSLSYTDFSLFIYHKHIVISKKNNELYSVIFLFMRKHI